jgi:hypothetical protein
LTDKDFIGTVIRERHLTSQTTEPIVYLAPTNPIAATDLAVSALPDAPPSPDRDRDTLRRRAARSLRYLANQRDRGQLGGTCQPACRA